MTYVKIMQILKKKNKENKINNDGNINKFDYFIINEYQ